jgi:hypothetical protein
MARCGIGLSLAIMKTPSSNSDEPLINTGAGDASLAALFRHVVSTPVVLQSFSVCGTCGRRVDGTDKRKYCGRECANRAILARRRLARSRLIASYRA